MIERDRTVLPEPDSPTMPRVSPASDRQGHPVDGPDRAPRGAEGGVQIVDHQQGLAGTADVGELEVLVTTPAAVPVVRRRSQQALADVEALAETVADEVDRQEQQEHGQRPATA